MSRIPSMIVIVFAGLALGSGAATAKRQQAPRPVSVMTEGTVQRFALVRLHSEVEVAAAPVAVWAALTRGSSFVTWCPEWKSPANAKVNLAKVGDVVDYADAWGNGGRSIVTYLRKDKELRVAHEPNQGDYMCQAKIVLAPTPTGTHVVYWEQYTDESTPKDLDATAAKMETEIAQALATLKKSIEKK